ncbi:MAG: hypothetical protein U1F48_11745 [Burkholderiales bacterium]
MGRFVNAPFLRARALGFERLAPSPAAHTAREVDGDGDACAVVPVRRRASLPRRMRAGRPRQG